MAKKKVESSPGKGNEPSTALERTGVMTVNISHEMRTAYLDYAMSVITSRA